MADSWFRADNHIGSSGWNDEVKAYDGDGASYAESDKIWPSGPTGPNWGGVLILNAVSITRCALVNFNIAIRGACSSRAWVEVRINKVVGGWTVIYQANRSGGGLSVGFTEALITAKWIRFGATYPAVCWVEGRVLDAQFYGEAYPPAGNRIYYSLA